jgi:hypothetical protein
MANKIQDAGGIDLSQAYTTWSDAKGFSKASQELNTGLQNSRPIHRSTGAIANQFKNIDGNTSVRMGASPLDYAWFRPGEMVAVHFRDIIAQCMGGYQKVPVIKQVIDLMGDFTGQGIRLVHEDETIQSFYREWFLRVNGPERTERIANILYRCGNVIIKRADAKLNPVAVQQWKKSSAATSDTTDLDHEDDVIPSSNIVPYRYTILNPLIVEVLGEHVAAFTGKVHYVLKMPSTFYNTLSLPLTSFDPSLLTQGMPRDLQQAMDNNEKYLLLDSDKLICLFYKKDDWDVWAYPMLYSLLDEIILLQKMKQADMTALDGVISHIRVWKLGSMEHKIFPTNAAITKLSDILLNHLAGGAMDLVWGPDLEIDSTSTDIANFLGSEKYEFCMNTIHGGLGIPAAIGRTKGSMTDNFMSIRVLIERLMYGRRVITQFWLDEIKRVQQAMGFKSPAKIMYDNMVLNDETAEKALWIQLLDRNVISVEAIQERFGRIPEIENILIMRENKARDAGKMSVKVSPYEDAEPDLSLTKIGMQTGIITPSELPSKFDLDLKKPSPDHQEIKDNMFPPPPEPAELPPPEKKPKPKGVSGQGKPKPKGVSGQGRPGGSSDKSKRKQRTAKPSAKGSHAETFMAMTNKGMLMSGAIAQIVDPYYLNKFGKAKLSDLSPDEGVELSKYKFQLLLNSRANDDPKPKVVLDIMDRPLQVYDLEADYASLCKAFQEKLGHELTPADLNMIQCYVYALVKGQENE